MTMFTQRKVEIENERDVVKHLTNCINQHVYKSIRLVDGDGTTNLTSFNRSGKGAEEQRKNCIEKLDSIISFVKIRGEVGRFYIDCRNFYAQKTKADLVPINVVECKPKELTGENNKEEIIDLTAQQEMEQIELKDYLKIVEEKERYRAEAAVLATENEILKKQLALYGDSGMGLGQAPTPVNTASDRLLTFAQEALPSVVALLDKYLGQREQMIEMKKAQMSDAPRPQNNNAKYTIWNNRAVSIANLMNSNQEAADRMLDDIQEKNPEMYKYICEKLGIEEGGDGGEDEGLEQAV